MKLFLPLLLVAIAGMEFAQTLKCYTCHEPTSSEKCMKIQKCGKNETMCKTTMYSLEEVYPFVGLSTVTKMCSSVCSPSDVDGIGMTRPVSCCYSNLCNIDGADGAASLRISFVPVGMLASVVCGLFWSRL